MKPKMLLLWLTAAWCAAAVVAFAADTPATAPDVATTAPAIAVTAQNVDQVAQQLIDQGLNYLQSAQLPDGGWAGPREPLGITGLALRALVQDPAHTTKVPFVRKGYDKLLSYQMPGGGIFKDTLATYNTAVAVSALAAADDPSLQPQLDKAIAYLRTMQWNDRIVGPKGETIADPKYAAFAGGFGYGRSGRPDLSNTQFALEALHEAGLKPDDEAFKNALAFINRCQNRSESNDQPWAGDDGGFIYTPASGGNSAAGSITMASGHIGWTSYGSMTYAGLKSMIYCGLTHDDPRVKAAVGWIQSHWTFDENPGMGVTNPVPSQNGLYYYFQTMGKALSAYDEPVMTDSQGKQHDWRIEIIAKMAALQHPDGSWVGQRRWMENNPVITTAYCVLAAEEARKSLAVHPAK